MTYCYIVHKTAFLFKQNVYENVLMFPQALAELCEIKFGKAHPVCNLVSTSIIIYLLIINVINYNVLLCYHIMSSV